MNIQNIVSSFVQLANTPAQAAGDVSENEKTIAEKLLRYMQALLE